jgi:chromate reductase
VLGGIRSQLGLQVVLNKLGVLVIPDSFVLGVAHQAFDPHGGLKDPNVENVVRGVGGALVAMVARR